MQWLVQHRLGTHLSKCFMEPPIAMRFGSFRKIPVRKACTGICSCSFTTKLSPEISTQHR